MAPGILYVTMQPKPELGPDKFEDWYNNEHGPLRLRLSFCSNGFRYRATDLDSTGKGLHEWMAIYDMDNLDGLNGGEYKMLRGPPVQTWRETDLRPHIDIDRRSFDFLREWKDHYQPVERLGGEQAGNVIISVLFTLKPGQDPEELTRWYDQEHVAMLQKVPGWRRSRRFKTSSVDPRPDTEYLALHEYAPDNGLGGPEFQAAITTPWTKNIYENFVASRTRRMYKHYYTFGPAPRHLSSVSDWSSPATLTRSIAPNAQSQCSAIESYVSTPDGARLQYRIEGASDPSAPVVLCINSILTHYDIYADFTRQFLGQNPGYRVLRYLSRGRTSSAGSTSPITLETLTEDAVHVLSTLRIPSVALAIGVSLGGATALNLGLRHPDHVPAFLACDTNSSAPPSNPKAWGERIAMAESDPTSEDSKYAFHFGGASDDVFVATTAGSDKVVGEQLAEATVRRWFVPESYDGGEIEARIASIKDMVRSNSLDGFKKSVNALYQYDFGTLMAGCKSRGQFLVGAGDGVLPEGMRKMAAALGDGRGGTGVKLTVVPGAGHLPMVEKPDEVVKAVEQMLKSA